MENLQLKKQVEIMQESIDTLAGKVDVLTNKEENR